MRGAAGVENSARPVVHGQRWKRRFGKFIAASVRLDLARLPLSSGGLPEWT